METVLNGDDPAVSCKSECTEVAENLQVDAKSSKSMKQKATYEGCLLETNLALAANAVKPRQQKAAYEGRLLGRRSCS